MTSGLPARLLVLGAVALLGIAPARGSAVTNTHQIEGYANRVSVGAQETITFYVHVPGGTVASPRPYSVEYRRFGPSNGTASAPTLVSSASLTNGVARSYPADAGTSGAGWETPPSPGVTSRFSLVVPNTWQSGIYVARLTDTQAAAPRPTFDITFVVRAGPTGSQPIALIASTNTWQAYNFWPGGANSRSFYFADCSPLFTVNPVNSVSSLRPNPYAQIVSANQVCPGDATGLPFFRTGHLAMGEVAIARWLELARPLIGNRGYSVLSDSDLGTNASILSGFQTVVLSTHSEYWTRQMYDSIKQFLDRGGNLVVLSGNTAYSWVRYQGSTMVRGDGLGNTSVGVANQSQLTGLTYSETIKSTCEAFSVTQPTHPLMAGTLTVLQTLIGTVGTKNPAEGCAGQEAAGWETDRRALKDNVLSSDHIHWLDRDSVGFFRGYQLLATGGPVPDGAEMVAAERASAGRVFNAGSIVFGQSLLQDWYEPAGSRRLTQLLVNVLNRFGQPSWSDFSSDGKPDLLVRQTATGNMWLYTGTGNGTFNLGGNNLGGNWNIYNQFVSPGDFNSDGKPDLLVRETATGNMWLYTGTGNGTFNLGGNNLGGNWSTYNAFAGVW